MSLDRIIFPPSAMCLFTFYIQLGFPQCMLPLWPLKSEFGSLVSTMCICYVWVAKPGNYWEKRREKEREREKEGEGEGKRERENINHLSTHICSHHIWRKMFTFPVIFMFNTELQNFQSATKQCFCCFLFLFSHRESKLVQYEYKPGSGRVNTNNLL